MKILSLGRATVLRLAAAGLAAAMLVSCGQPSPEKLMAAAKEYLAKGDRNAAVIELKNLLAKTPDNGEARLLLGEALLEAEDYPSAEKELARALELKQPQEKVVPAYLRALLAQGKYQAVVAEVEKYKLFNPAAVAAAQTALGDAHMQLGSRSRAHDAYAAALAAVPGFARARLGEAMLVAMEGRTDESLKQIDEIIAAEPKLAEAHAFRADILLARGDRDGAKKALQDAIAANDRYLPPRLALIGMLSDDRDFDGAAKLIESTRAVAPRDVRVNYLDASLAFRKGERDRARQQVQVVLKHLPDHVPSLVLAGGIEFQDKQMSAAEAHLRRAVTVAPNHLGARLLLIQTYLQHGKPGLAKDALTPLIEKGMINDPRLQLLAGETFLANGDSRRAADFYQAAAKGATTEQATARTRLGQIALATGRSDEGFRELEVASELDVGKYQADLAIISAHLRRNEIERAMAAVQALEKKQPTNPLTFQMYGVVQLAKGDAGAARKSFERALELQPMYLPAAYNLAQLDVLQKRPEVASMRYEAMIAKEPGNDQLYITLAELQLRTGASAKEIAETLRRGISASPQSPGLRVALISFLSSRGDTKAASTAAQEALAVIASEPHLLDTAAAAREAAGEINQAIETYNKLAALVPQSTLPLYRLAALYVRQNDTNKAIESLRRAQRLAPSNVDVVPRLVQVFLASQRYDEAIKEARDLQKQRPKLPLGFVLEGDVYLKQRQFADAERLYREALKLEPLADAVAVKLHVVLWESGRKQEADAWSKKWLSERPRDVAMRMHLAERSLADRSIKAAAAHYQAVIAIDPENATALNNLAWIGGELGDRKAVGYAERAVRISPNNPSFLDTHGMLLVRAGETDKGIAELERARTLATGRRDIQLHLAKALIKAGRKDEARKELEALQAVKENFPGKEEVVGLVKGL